MPVIAPGMPRRFAQTGSADMREILEALRAMGMARRGKTEGAFLP
jgi:hypothetical protein